MCPLRRLGLVVLTKPGDAPAARAMFQACHPGTSNDLRAVRAQLFHQGVDDGRATAGRQIRKDPSITPQQGVEAQKGDKAGRGSLLCVGGQRVTGESGEKASLKEAFRGLDWPRVGLLVGMMIFYGLTLRFLGFVISSIIFLMGGFWILGERRIWMVLVGSIPLVSTPGRETTS